jgi:hypothetical protein
LIGEYPTERTKQKLEHIRRDRDDIGQRHTLSSKNGWLEEMQESFMHLPCKYTAPLLAENSLLGPRSSLW